MVAQAARRQSRQAEAAHAAVGTRITYHSHSTLASPTHRNTSHTAHSIVAARDCVLCRPIVVSQREKEQALAYVEREVRQLQDTFDVTQQQHTTAQGQLTTQLHTKQTEVTQLQLSLEAAQRQLAEKEVVVRELRGRVEVGEARVLSVESEMRYLLGEMASRQKLAKQLAQTLTILP